MTTSKCSSQSSCYVNGFISFGKYEHNVFLSLSPALFVWNRLVQFVLHQIGKLNGYFVVAFKMVYFDYLCAYFLDWKRKINKNSLKWNCKSIFQTGFLATHFKLSTVVQSEGTTFRNMIYLIAKISLYAALFGKNYIAKMAIFRCNTFVVCI